jgi:hypothetical protein
MTTEPTSTPPSGSWGDPAAAPAGPKKSWSGRKTAIAAGVAVVIAVGGGLAIWAGTSSNATEQAAQGGPGGRGFGGPPGAGAGNFGGGATALRDAVHGDFVVSDGKGGYTTERLQTGDVTEVSATSISLTSKDGYKQVYTIDSTTEKGTDPKTGANVTVVAKLSGTTATATSISTPVPAGRGVGQGQGRGAGQGRQGQPPATP